MKIIAEIIKNYEIVSIIGLAKNAGKTVTLNYLIQESFENNITIGITSTGRDGENKDIVTNTDKPLIYVEEDTVVATAASTLNLTDANLEILESTDYKSPMGEILICKVIGSGTIQIAGPVSSVDMLGICKKMKSYGAQVIFIDGAVDRKAISSPMISDACIISSGAVLSRDIKKVIEKTAHIVECYSLPKINDLKNTLGNKKIVIIQDNDEIIEPKIKTSITGGKKILLYVDDKTKYIYIKGAVTSRLLDDLSESKYFNNFKILIDDGTKLFIDPYKWNQLKRKGLKIEVLNKINIIAVTLNPISPYGYFFDSKELLEQMKAYLPDIRIMDVMSCD